MRKQIFTFGILFMLFFSMFIPITFGSNIKISNEIKPESNSSDDDVDWWSMFHHDLQHSGYSTSNAPHTDNVLWSYTTGFVVESSPAVADGKVFFGSWDSNVYCLDANSGGYIWNYTTGACVSSSPAVADGKVYIGSDDNKLYCLDANSGGYIWNYTTEDCVSSSPAVADGKVYIGSNDNKLYCLDANSGGYIWSYETGDYVSSSPAVADGKVYIGSEDSYVYCLNATSGVYIWSYKTGAWVDSSPAVADGKVFIGSWDFTVYAFEYHNRPPDKPDINGPPNGKPGIEYTFCITPTDPDGDSLYVKWDWGDGEITPWLGPYESGTEICESHKWSKSGRYIIKVTVRDDYGASVTASLEINIPRTRAWLRFIDMFPLLQRILSYIL